MAARKTAKKLERADRKASDAAGVASDHRLVRAAGALSELGDQPPLRLLCAATIAAGLLRHDAKLAGTGIRMLAAHTLATWTKTGIKSSIDRTRPDASGAYRMERGSSDEHDLSSFPSGHTAGAVAVAEAFARDYPEHTFAARSAAAAIALIQVPRAKHFIGDVVVGAMIGLVAERAVALVVPALEPTRDMFYVAMPPSANLRRAPSGS